VRSRLVISARWLWWALVEWAVIIACLWAAGRWPWLLPVWMLIIGSRQGALAVLMHEAVHYNGVGSRRVNDVVGNLLTAWPLGLDLASYRDWHLPHHVYLGTPLDTEWQLHRRYPGQYTDLTPARRRSILLRDLCGLHWREPIEVIHLAGWHWSAGRAAYYALIAALALAGWWWQVLLYQVCALTTGWMWMRLRIWSEHVDAGDGLTHEYVASIPQRLTYSPHRIWRHRAHHKRGQWDVPGWDL